MENIAKTMYKELQENCIEVKDIENNIVNEMKQFIILYLLFALAKWPFSIVIDWCQNDSGTDKKIWV